MNGQAPTQSDRLQGACSLLTNAESTILFVCRQVAESKMTPEMALLKIHVDALPTIVSARNGVGWVKDELSASEKNKEGDNRQ